MTAFANARRHAAKTWARSAEDGREGVLGVRRAKKEAGFSGTQWRKRDGRCKGCTKPGAVNRVCSECGAKEKDDFSYTQWRKGDNSHRRCRVCTTAAEPEAPKMCSGCDEAKDWRGFSDLQWRKGDQQRRCLVCDPQGPQPEKSCSSCGEAKDNAGYSHHQWNLGSTLRCLACVLGNLLESGSFLQAQAQAQEAGSSSDYVATTLAATSKQPTSAVATQASRPAAVGPECLFDSTDDNDYEVECAVERAVLTPPAQCPFKEFGRVGLILQGAGSRCLPVCAAAPQEIGEADSETVQSATSPAASASASGAGSSSTDDVCMRSADSDDYMAPVREALRRMNLLQYAATFAELGFDDLEFLMEEGEAGRLDKVAKKAKMLPGHEARFVDWIGTVGKHVTAAILRAQA